MMERFKDSNGDEWVIRLNLGTFDEVEEKAGIKLYDALEDSQKFAELLFSPRNLGKLLWVLCEDQAIERSIDQKEFAKRIDATVLEHAGEAVMGVIANFFPRSKVALYLKNQLKTNLTEMDDAIIKVLNKRSGN